MPSVGVIDAVVGIAALVNVLAQILLNPGSLEPIAAFTELRVS